MLAIPCEQDTKAKKHEPTHPVRCIRYLALAILAITVSRVK